jgi:hypothetical protein
MPSTYATSSGAPTTHDSAPGAALRGREHPVRGDAAAALRRCSGATANSTELAGGPPGCAGVLTSRTGLTVFSAALGHHLGHGVDPALAQPVRRFGAPSSPRLGPVPADGRGAESPAHRRQPRRARWTTALIRRHRGGAPSTGRNHSPHRLVRFPGTMRRASRSGDAPSDTRSGDGRHRPTTTRVIVVGIGPPRPDRTPAGVRKPAPVSPDHGHNPCHRTRSESGRPGHPTPFGMSAVTRHESKTHSCSLIRNGERSPDGVFTFSARFAHSDPLTVNRQHPMTDQ